MPHISKKRIDPRLWKRMSSQLLKIFAEAKDKGRLYTIFNELFTQTEKIMFAKRVAMVLMLDHGIPQDKICTMLGVSPTTVAKMSLNIELGKFDSILKLSKQEEVDLEDVVYLLATAGGILPPRFGGKKYWTKYKARS